MKPTIGKIYEFIAKLIILLEMELDELYSAKPANTISAKKNITDTLNKLVTLIIQLNKLSSEEEDEQSEISLEKDKKVVEEYIREHKE